ncbi:MAG: esterase [Actinobacteria bacterium]|nr:esterase [Actinomycetota bacterium]MCA1720135.1 esterase [Actinomycetota bacterium]
MTETVTFRMPDPHRTYSGVRLQQDVRLPGDALGFTRDGDDWVLTVPRPDVDRMEYSFELQHADGSEWVCDPVNPNRVGGAFGDKSVLELPGYCVPEWLQAEPARGERQELSLPTRALDQEVPGVLWSSVDSDPSEPLPLLVVHDGPEYDALASLTLFLDAMVAVGRLPAMRAALLAPVDRNSTYSASAPYSRALALGVVPKLHEVAPATVTMGMGASLGGLAMLHAQRHHPGTFAGLYLQSSSFFHRVLDEQESGFERFQRITAFVDSVLRAGPAVDPVPVVLTCGLIEENVENNRLMTRALGAQGYDTRLVENRDVHTYTGWRDTFDPNLVDLVRRVLQ